VTREEALARLAELQARVRELRAAADTPALERTMQVLDVYCHLARWQLGDVAAMVPELEAEGPAPSPP
jgi:hypothetical protein